MEYLVDEGLQQMGFEREGAGLGPRPQTHQRRQTLKLITLIALGLLVALCGCGDQSHPKVNAVERRVSELETPLRTLQAELQNSVVKPATESPEVKRIKANLAAGIKRIRANAELWHAMGNHGKNACWLGAIQILLRAATPPR